MDISFLLVFFAGLVSFLSPCVLPIIPGYISFISGISFNELTKKQDKKIIVKSILFTIGFSIVFIALGSTASILGKFFLNNSNLLRIFAGIIIIIFSFQLLGVFNFKFLNKELKFFTNKYNNNFIFPVIVGAAFGFGWTPCIGPILGSVLAIAATEDSFYQSIFLLSFYSLGLAIPFIISAALIEKFLFFSKNMNKYLPYIFKFSGVILLLTGIAIISGQLQILGFFILEYFPILGKIG